MKIRVETERTEVVVKSGTVVKFGAGKPTIFAGSLVKPADQILKATAARSMIQDAVDEIFVWQGRVGRCRIREVSVGKEGGVVGMIGFELGCVKYGV